MYIVFRFWAMYYYALGSLIHNPCSYSIHGTRSGPEAVDGQTHGHMGCGLCRHRDVYIKGTAAVDIDIMIH